MRKQWMLGAATALAVLMAGRAWSADTPTGVINGHLNDPYGKSAANVKVQLVRKARKNETDPPATQPKGKGDPFSATTDADGYFKFDAVPPGEYNVEARDGRAKADSIANVIAGGSLDLKMQLVVRGKKKPAPAN